MKKATLASFLIIALFLSLFGSTPGTRAQGLGNCQTGYEAKIDGNGSAPVTYTSANIITSVIVKAGSQNQEDACYSFTADGNDGCYAIVGIGTNTVTITKTGSGPDCKDVSHAEFFVTVAGTPTPTPSASPTATPSATPSVSPSPSSDPSPTPSSDPSPTPTATPTSTPTATPTSTPSNNGGGNGGSSSSSSSSSNGTGGGGQVLGASTLAKTGTAENQVAAFSFLAGLAVTTASAFGFFQNQKRN